MSRARCIGVVTALALCGLAQGDVAAQPEGAEQVGEASGVAAEVTETAQPKKKKKRKKKRKKRRRKKVQRMSIETELSANSSSGFLSGDTTLRQSAAFVDTGVRVRPEIEHRNWRLQLPVSLGDRRTAFAELGESKGALGLRLRYRPQREFALTLRSDVAGRWRGDWPDQYQPLPDGSLGRTDRFSRWRRSVGLELASVLTKNHLKADYQYELFDYREDPNFDPTAAPTHIVPGDRGVHSLDLSYMRWGKKTKTGGGLKLGREESFFAFSRDAGTGATHAPPGGLPPNPLQVLLLAEPYVAWEYGRLKDIWQLDLLYGVDVVSDRFEGYYSSLAHHVKVDYGRKLFGAGKAKAGAELYWRRYGENSYEAGGSRPELSYGDRRVDRKLLLDSSYEHAVSKHWILHAEGKLRVRRTNYPDYVPMVYPTNRQYDLRWNYTNVLFALGVEWQH